MSEPQWMTWARAQIGTRETPGAANNPKILNWAQRLGARVLGIAYTADATPWCGLFAAAAVAQAGLTPPAIAIRAREWARWGEGCTPCVGAILVFERPGGGHVGFCAGEDDQCFHVLGGNQSDAVTIARIEKARLVACRWPAGLPITTKRKIVARSGAISRNEA